MFEIQGLHQDPLRKGDIVRERDKLEIGPRQIDVSFDDGTR